jgi:galactonate dehydratase
VPAGIWLCLAGHANAGESANEVKGLEVLRCGAGWRNYHFLKLTADEGVAGWSEFDEGFGSPGPAPSSSGSPGVSAVIERLAGRVVGQPVFDHERIYTELYCFTRPAAGGVVAEGLGAIENALLDAKAKALGVGATGSSEAGCEIVFGSIGRIARLGG